MALKLLYVLSALDAMNMAIFGVTFGPHVRKIGGSITNVGIIFTCTALIALFWNPVAINMSDKHGRKKVLIRCLLMSLLGNIGTIFAYESYSMVFFLRLICAFGAPAEILIRNLVIDFTKNNKKSNVMNDIGKLSQIMFVVGAITGGFTNELFNGFPVVFTIISINLAIILSCTLQLPDLKQKTPENKKPQGNKLFAGLKALKDINVVQYWELFAIKLLMDLCFVMWQVNLNRIMSSAFKIRGRYTGYVLTLFRIFGLLASFSLTKIKSVYANDDGFTKLQHGGIMLIICFLGLGLFADSTILLSALAFMSMAKTLVETSSPNTLLNQTSKKDTVGVQTVFESIFSVIQIISPVLAGLIADKYGVQFPMVLCIIPALASVMIVRRQMTKVKKE